jgi:transposase
MDEHSLAVGALVDIRQSGISDQASTNIRRAYSSISNEKRGLIIHAIDSLGWSVTATAKHYQVSQTTVSNIKRVFYTEGGRINKKVTSGRRAPKLSDERAKIIRQWVDNDCLLSLSSIRREVLRQFGTQISNSTISRILRAFHYTIKRTSIVAERASSFEVIQSRIHYAGEYLAIMSRREKIFS